MTKSVVDPMLAYTERMHGLRDAQREQMRQDKALGMAKVGTFIVLIAVCVWLIEYSPLQIYFSLIPALALLVLTVVHERVLQALTQSKRLIAMYERSLARLENRWAGGGETGARYLLAEHPYARDLDIFGVGSVFELLCTTRTRAGEDTLANWLMSAASQREIRARQDAVEELRIRQALRENLATTGEDVRAGVDPEALADWGEDHAVWNPSVWRWIAAGLAVLWLASLVRWGLTDHGTLFLAMSLVNLSVTGWLGKRVHKAASGVARAARDLSVLAKILACMEQEKFSTEKLLGLQVKLRTHGETASHAIAELGRWMDWLESGENWFVKIVDPFVFWTAQCVFALEDWRVQYGAAIRQWMDAVGEMETLSALACYAYEHPENIFPEFVHRGPHLEVKGLAHPLLPRGTAIPNDLYLDQELQLLMISGPNMAGKSTFLRGVGMNAVLAQCGAPVRATRFVLSSLAVTASICVLDSLQGGISRFYAEIQRLKHISDLTEQSTPVLFLLDELLSGTNSHDRRLGTELIVNSLLAHGAVGLVTTHDLALTEIARAMEGRAKNLHFADRFEDGELRFDYHLHPGVVQTSNALQLMRAVGLKI